MMTTFHVKFGSLPEPVEVEILEEIPPRPDEGDWADWWYRVRLPDGRTTRVTRSRIIVRDTPTLEETR